MDGWEARAVLGLIWLKDAQAYYFDGHVSVYRVESLGSGIRRDLALCEYTQSLSRPIRQ
jgi:hypothetical protein